SSSGAPSAIPEARRYARGSALRTSGRLGEDIEAADYPHNRWLRPLLAPIRSTRPAGCPAPFAAAHRGAAGAALPTRNAGRELWAPCAVRPPFRARDTEDLRNRSSDEPRGRWR